MARKALGPKSSGGERMRLRARAATIHARSSGLTLPAALSAVVLVAACGGRNAGSGAGSWQFKVDTTRSETDGSVRETSWLRVIGQEGPEGAAGTNAVILSFDC